MQLERQSNGCWVPYESRAALLASLPKTSCELLETNDTNSWGYMAFDSDVVIPVGYADMGLRPIGVRRGNRIFIGIDELLVGYDCSDRSVIFRYKMPTLFHEFVRFGPTGFIARDEIGFVCVSYEGNERWSFCIDLISTYKIERSKILGKTEEGKNFEFIIPSAESEYPAVV